MFLIPDKPGVHHNTPVKACLAEHIEPMVVLHLVSHSPEVSPARRHRAGLKQAPGARAARRAKAKQATENHREDPERRPQAIRACFQAPEIKHAA